VRGGFECEWHFFFWRNQDLTLPLVKDFPRHLKPWLIQAVPGERIRGLLNKALSQAQKVSSQVKKQAISQMNAKIDAEITRMKVIQAKSNKISSPEFEWWNERKAQLLNAYSNAQIR
jgi:hypothetical protein